MMIERPTTGGKRPRSMFRNIAGPPDYGIVNFLKNGQKTDDQEIVPMFWIVNGKKPMCCWPIGEDLTRHQLDRMVQNKIKPTDDQFEKYAVRIILSNCTFAEAKRKFDDLALKSTSEGDIGNGPSSPGSVHSVPSPPSSTGSSSGSEGGEEDEEEEGSSAGKKKKTSTNKKKPSKKKGNGTRSSTVKNKHQESIDLNKSFEFVDDMEEVPSSNAQHDTRNQSGTPESNGVNLPNNAIRGLNRAPKNSSGSSHGPPARVGSHGSPINTSVTRQLFAQGQPAVSADAFKAFETRLFQKLNTIQQMVSDVLQTTRTGSTRELVSMPAAVADNCTTPATKIQHLEELDSVLADKTVASTLANYLSQLGGKSIADFLGRAMPMLISDEVCFVTNWSGSAIPPGTMDAKGKEITREFKKTFSNLSHIVQVLCASSRLACKGATDRHVETYIQKWLLSYKDRISPRKHNKQATTSRRSPRKKQHSS